MNKSIRVLVVDPFPVVRQGLFSLLQPAADLDLVAETDDNINAIPLCSQKLPDVLILGVITPDLSTLVIHKCKIAQPS